MFFVLYPPPITRRWRACRLVSLRNWRAAAFATVIEVRALLFLLYLDLICCSVSKDNKRAQSVGRLYQAHSDKVASKARQKLFAPRATAISLISETISASTPTSLTLNLLISFTSPSTQNPRFVIASSETVLASGGTGTMEIVPPKTRPRVSGLRRFVVLATL